MKTASLVRGAGMSNPKLAGRPSRGHHKPCLPRRNEGVRYGAMSASAKQKTLLSLRVDTARTLPRALPLPSVNATSAGASALAAFYSSVRNGEFGDHVPDGATERLPCVRLLHDQHHAEATWKNPGARQAEKFGDAS